MLILQAMVFGLLIGGFIVFLGFFLKGRRSLVRKRLQAPQTIKADLLKQKRGDKPAFLGTDLIENLEKKLDLEKGGNRSKVLQQKLIHAGIYNEQAIPIFLGVKMGMLMVLPILVIYFLWNYSPQNGMLYVGICGFFALGYILPDFILSHIIKTRQQKIRESLPDALDLMVVCVESGQGLNAAIKRVSDELMESNPIIAREMLMVNLEIMAGLERGQALKNLGERTGVEELISLCNILIQSDRFGTSLGQALRTQSDFMRTSRRQKLEELAAKTPVKLIFPLLLFIFPAIIVVVLGPAIIQISEMFKTMK
jgi:tight adherence protein C